MDVRNPVLSGSEGRDFFHGRNAGQRGFLSVRRVFVFPLESRRFRPFRDASRRLDRFDARVRRRKRNVLRLTRTLRGIRGRTREDRFVRQRPMDLSGQGFRPLVARRPAGRPRYGLWDERRGSGPAFARR